MSGRTRWRKQEVKQYSGTDAVLNLTEGTSLSRAIFLYSHCRNYTDVAQRLGVHRPLVHRAMSAASKHLLASKDREEKALGAYVHSLVQRSSSQETGVSKREIRKNAAPMKLVDPKILGEFVLSAADEQFDSVLQARANF